MLNLSSPLRGSLNQFHQLLGQSTPVVRFAILLRNQLNCVIRYHLAEGANPLQNGELTLIQQIASDLRIFIDVGANVGDWSHLLIENAAHYEKGLLFEPSDCAVEQLKQRFSHSEKLEIIQAAASDTVGELPFFEEPESGETSSLVAGFSRSTAIQKLVKTTTLDTEIAKHGFQAVNLLKIDTEGYDLHVLRGATRSLSQQSIEIIQFEYNAPWAIAGSTLCDARKLLESFGYEVFLLKSEGLFRLNYELYGEYFSYSNFIAVSPKKLASLQSFIKGTI